MIVEENFEPAPLSPDLEWMLQSNQVSDSDLVRQLAQEYARPLRSLGLFILRDERLSAQATAAALQQVARQRRKYWGQVPLRAWVYAQALKQVQCRMSLAWRLRRWSIRVKTGVSSLEGSHVLRQALLDLDQRWSLPIWLVYGHQLSTSEAAYTLGLTPARLDERLAEAEQRLPAHTPDELVQAAQVADDEDPHHLTNTASSSQSQGENPSAQGPAGEAQRFQRWVFSHVMLDLVRQRRLLGWRRLAAELFLFSVVLVSALGIGVYALRSEGAPLNPLLIETATPDVVIYFVDITSTPRPHLDERFWVSRGSVSSDATLGPEPRLFPTPLPTQTPKPRRNQLDLEAAIQAAQVDEPTLYQWENSAPLLLAVLTQYWHSPVDTASLSASLRPNPKDAAVFPYEIENYIFNYTPLRGLYRFGGDISLLRRLLDARLPPLIQISYENQSEGGWAAGYALVTGFDDFQQQISLLVVDGTKVSTIKLAYSDLLQAWAPFAYAYFVISLAEVSGDVSTALGNNFSEGGNYYAARLLLEKPLKGDTLDQFWRLFSLGTVYTYQQRYDQAAKAYDQAYALYDKLPAGQRPWRALWYNSRPYWAYFYTKQFQKVIDLADETLAAAGERGLEESLYWRALARWNQNDNPGAVVDLEEALRLNPNFSPGVLLLERIKDSGG